MHSCVNAFPTHLLSTYFVSATMEGDAQDKMYRSWSLPLSNNLQRDGFTYTSKLYYTEVNTQYRNK